MEWIISANPMIYDHYSSFEMNGFIDWKQTRNFNVGDIVYIYCSRPISKIQYKTYVEKINLTKAEIVDESIYWKNNNINTCNRFMRLRLVQYINSAELAYSVLKEHGMRYAPQSPCIAKRELSTYLKLYFKG